MILKHFQNKYPLRGYVLNVLQCGGDETLNTEVSFESFASFHGTHGFEGYPECIFFTINTCKVTFICEILSEKYKNCEVIMPTLFI